MRSRVKAALRLLARLFCRVLLLLSLISPPKRQAFEATYCLKQIITNGKSGKANRIQLPLE